MSVKVPFYEGWLVYKQKVLSIMYKLLWVIVVLDNTALLMGLRLLQWAKSTNDVNETYHISCAVMVF